MQCRVPIMTTLANISWLNRLFFSKFIALSEADVSVLLILKHSNTFIAKRTVNDIEASIQSTNGIYRLISFLPLIPAVDLSSASIFLSCGKIRLLSSGSYSPKISKVLSFFLLSDLSEMTLIQSHHCSICIIPQFYCTLEKFRSNILNWKSGL